MNKNGVLYRLKRYFRQCNGWSVTDNIDLYYQKIESIKAFCRDYDTADEATLKDAIAQLKTFNITCQNIDTLLPQTFGIVYTTIRRVLGITPFDVQMIGGIVLHEGKLAEMQTGEGKTLTAVFPAVLHALGGNGVHILTFNDYLARRDAQWMGPVYTCIGLTCGYINEGMTPEKRREAYRCDITYCTAKEAGFDFLRDELCYASGRKVHRPFHYAIIDEADSILIDEARIPLVIATAADGNAPRAVKMSDLVRTLDPDIDLGFDSYSRNVYLTESGITAVEGALGCGNLYDEQNHELLQQLHYALHAEYLLFRDRDYIVRNKQIELVDEFTGRVADKRRWPDGLQAALEAKENPSQDDLDALKVLRSVYCAPLDIRIEISWPAEVPYAQRKKALYNLEVYRSE
jgi:preprotein translocase subunit SecA